MLDSIEVTHDISLVSKQLSTFQNASIVVERAKDAQLEAGSPRVSGAYWISEERLSLITQQLETDPLLQAAGANTDANGGIIRTLLERFEEMCRRREVELPSDTSIESVYRLLALELLANASQLEVEESRLISCTIGSSPAAYLALEEEEFASLRDSPYIFRVAATKTPWTFRERLSWIVKEQETILREDEFKSYRKLRWLVTRAVVSSPSSSRQYLRDVEADVESILGDRKFKALRKTPGRVRAVVAINRTNPKEAVLAKSQLVRKLKSRSDLSYFADSPSMFWEAVLQRPRDPAKYLLGVKAAEQEVQTDPKYEAFCTTPWVVRRILTSSPQKDLEEELKRIHTTIADIIAEEEFASLADCPGVITRAVVKTPKKARKHLRSFITAVDALLSMDEFECFRSQPGTVRQVVNFAPRKAKERLRWIRDKEAEFLKDPLFEYFHDTPWVLRHCLVHNPRKPQKRLLALEGLIGAICSEEEFALFANRLRLVERVVMSNPSAPRRTLRDIRDSYDGIMNNAEFSWAHKKKRAVLHLCTRNRQTAAVDLREIRITGLEILADPEFYDLGKTPSLAYSAGFRYGTEEAKPALRLAMSNGREVLSNPRFSFLQAHRGWVFRICLEYPNSYMNRFEDLTRPQPVAGILEGVVELIAYVQEEFPFKFEAKIAEISGIVSDLRKDEQYAELSTEALGFAVALEPKNYRYYLQALLGNEPEGTARRRHNEDEGFVRWGNLFYAH